MGFKLMRLLVIACLLSITSVSSTAKPAQIMRSPVPAVTRVLQAVALGATMLLTTPAITQGESSAASENPADETYRHFSNSVYTWYTNHDAASWRSSVLTLGVSTKYEASSPTSEGSVRGWFRTSIWKSVTKDDSAKWFGYDDFGVGYDLCGNGLSVHRLLFQ